jgi:hypothetical protein
MFEKFEYCEVESGDPDYREREYLQSYKNALAAVRRTPKTAHDVEAVCIALSEKQDMEYFDYKAGVFLSALINTSHSRNFRLHIGHLQRPVYVLGVLNTKNITIWGDCGDLLGFRMRGGRIIVYGEAGADVGCEMKNGKIIVNGDVAESAGEGMSGGKLVVKGNAGETLASDMKGGEIIVHGKIKGFAAQPFAQPMSKGKITIFGREK